MIPLTSSEDPSGSLLLPSEQEREGEKLETVCLLMFLRKIKQQKVNKKGKKSLGF